MPDYHARVADRLLKEGLEDAGAVLVSGARGTGKTSTAGRLAGSVTRLDVDRPMAELARAVPEAVLAGASPRLIDEWQLAPDLWNHVRRVVDERGLMGQFILTGSANPANDPSRHSGSGRFVHIRMRPMTWSEFYRPDGAISLSEVLASGRVNNHVQAPIDLAEIARRIDIGGWPVHTGKPIRRPGNLLGAYLDDICTKDAQRLGHRRNARSLRRMVEALARSTACEVSLKTLSTDAGGAGGALSFETSRAYLDVLEDLMVLEPQPAWAPKLRSKVRLRGAPKYHLVDPSLAAVALKATADRLVNSPEVLGQLFESTVVRDLRVYGGALDADVYHYRDANGAEIDIVLELADGRWAGFEVKLGSGSADVAAKALIAAAAKIDIDRHGPPALLAVIVPGGLAYTRPDGVSVLPLNMLTL